MLRLRARKFFLITGKMIYSPCSTPCVSQVLICQRLKFAAFWLCLLCSSRPEPKPSYQNFPKMPFQAYMNLLHYIVHLSNLHCTSRLPPAQKQYSEMIRTGALVQDLTELGSNLNAIDFPFSSGAFLLTHGFKIYRVHSFSNLVAQHITLMSSDETSTKRYLHITRCHSLRKCMLKVCNGLNRVHTQGSITGVF
jgi:hypothetical protein